MPEHRASRRRLVPVLATLLGGVALFFLLAAGGFGQVGTACAQIPAIPGIPTVGPIDPSCQRIPDTDADGVLDLQDNCQGSYNPSQADVDADSGPKPYQPVKIFERDPMTGGDSCDVDDDGDGIKDVSDVCPKVVDKDQADGDGDGVGDACDPTPTVANQAGPAGAAGTTVVRPKLTVSGLRSRHRLAELRSGLAVPARCSAPCALSAELTADRNARRRLGSSTAVISRGGGGIERAGTTFVFLRLTDAARARLRRAGRVRLALRVVAADDSGRRSTVRRAVVITR